MTAESAGPDRVQHMVTADGVRLAFRDSGGPGFPLVMLHGLGQTQDAFSSQFDSLGASRRVITMDFRGHGGSAKPNYGYRIARLAVDVSELMEHLSIDRFDALGWSMGASVWWSYIDTVGTERMRRLIIVDQPTVVAKMPWMTADDHARAGSMWDLATLEEIVAGQCAPGAPAAGVESLRFAYRGDMDPSILDALVTGMRAGSLFEIGKLLFDHSTQDWRDVLPRIDVPTLVIGAEGSHVTTASQRHAASLIPGARAHIFPEDVASSHFPFLQNPRAFDEVLEEFLGE